MLQKLIPSKLVVGVKQTCRALRDGRAQQIYIASDADPELIAPIAAICNDQCIPTTYCPTMAALGEAAGIQVGAAVVTLLK